MTDPQHEQVGIELGLRWVFHDPSGRPRTQRPDRLAELLAGAREPIPRHPGVVLVAVLDDAEVGEGPESWARIDRRSR
jgi:hypothetical protein